MTKKQHVTRTSKRQRGALFDVLREIGFRPFAKREGRLPASVDRAEANQCERVRESKLFTFSAVRNHESGEAPPTKLHPQPLEMPDLNVR